MGTLTVQNIIDRCARLLYDQTNIKWSRTELLDHLNAGQRAIAIAAPTTLATVAVMQCVAGSRQVIPSGGWLLLDVIRNMGTNGTTPGRSVRIISRRLLESYDPLWQTGTTSPTVQSYWYDIQDQTGFFVYPPNTGAGYIEINYSAQPNVLTSEAQTITVPDVVDSALVNYVMFRACSKVADFSPGAQLAGQYLETFNQMMGAKLTSEQANNPNLGLLPPDAGMRGGTS
jgi:hypothetical protein